MAMCIETRLPLLSLNNEKYEKAAEIMKIKLIDKDKIVKNNSPDKILN
ncbi:MAG: hypothetical protein JSS91_09185 [Bacteroidetes bacterium]|nr:hypothetical protein [Bacteroidota bacterium]